MSVYPYQISRRHYTDYRSLLIPSGGAPAEVILSECEDGKIGAYLTLPEWPLLSRRYGHHAHIYLGRFDRLAEVITEATWALAELNVTVLPDPDPREQEAPPQGFDDIPF